MSKTKTVKKDKKKTEKLIIIGAFSISYVITGCALHVLVLLLKLVHNQL